MRNALIASTLLLLAMFRAADLLAQNGAGAAPAVPDLNGIWETPYAQSRKDICGEPNCRALGALPNPPPNIPLDEPQMLPWVEERYNAVRQDVRNPKSPVREELDPWLSGCMPMGPTRLMLTAFVLVEIRQFPDVVLLFFGGTAGEGDHTVRRVYLDGRAHPPNWKPTWMGHSTGRYDGDTLVVDTVGMNDKSWLDGQGYPHSDALHLTERFRRADPTTLEYEVTIEDPKAYKNSWRRKIVRHLAAPGPHVWDTSDCEETLRMGTHYSAEAKK